MRLASIDFTDTLNVSGLILNAFLSSSINVSGVSHFRHAIVIREALAVE